MELQQWQLAYIAGLIDGEGSLECQRQVQRHGKTPRYVLRLSFVFSTEEPLRTLGEWLGCPPKRYAATDAKRQVRWRVGIPKNTAVPLLQACLPYLILKRDQAELVLAIEAVRAEHSPSRHLPVGHRRQMPAGAVLEMERLHRHLRSLKSGKRPAQLRI